MGEKQNMSVVIESATFILSSSEKRIATIAQNVAGSQVSGHKRSVSFSEALQNQDQASSTELTTSSVADLTQGRLSLTEKSLDLAIAGPAFFQVRSGEDLVYTRGGSFALGEGGVLEDVQGRILQEASGGDIVIGNENLEVLADGTVLENGLPSGRIATLEAQNLTQLQALADGSFRAAEGNLRESSNSQVRQGFLEDSNTILSDEMVDLIASVRHAETGSRIAQFYDQLMGQAITTFTRS